MALKKEGVFTYHILQDRERKNLAILELIRKKGPVSRAEISRTLGFNIVTITNYTDYYIDKKFILEVGYDVSSGGRRPELLELNPKSGYIVGVDFGPEAITAIVADLKISVIAKVKVPRPHGTMEDLTHELINIIKDVVKKAGIEKGSVKNIGMGVSGIVDYSSGMMRDTDPRRGRTRVNFLKFGKTVEEEFGIPAYIGNDASCAAFGEQSLNPVADVDNLIYLYSDVGCGMVIHGDVYIGSSGCAGETQIAFDGLQSDDGNYIEEYTHMRPWGVDLGIVSEAKKAVSKGAATEILSLAKGDLQQISKDIIIEAAKKKDKLALGLLEDAGKRLGVRVAYMTNLFNPDIIVIGGGVERAGDLLLDHVKKTVKKFAFEESSGIVKIIPSLLGDDIVVLGAAALAARELFIQA